MQTIDNYVSRSKVVFAEEDTHLSYCYEHAIIMLYKSFERFILRSMISCLNHDHSHFEERYGIKLGNHINDDVCEFLVTKGGFFDFKGRGGLNKILNSTIGTNHNIGKTIKQTKYGDAIDQLCAVRNYAAHNSVQAKNAVLSVYKMKRIPAAGYFLMQQNRLKKIMRDLTDLANEVKTTPM